MKFEYQESKFGLDIWLTPETTKEVAELLRFTKNVKAQAPSIEMSFNGNEPTFYLGMEKIKESVQQNRINNKKK